MQRIFASLAVVSTILFGITLVLGLNIGNPADVPREVVSRHILAAMATLGFACLVHAIVLTYFMGTGRWMEETTRAYSLQTENYNACRRIKYRTVLALTGCIALIVLTVLAGAAADTAPMHKFQGMFGLSPDKLHLVIALVNLIANLGVYVVEYIALFKNGQLVNEILDNVQRIRKEQGLPVA